MVINRLDRGESQTAMDEWVNMCPQLPDVDGEYSVIRNDITNLFTEVKDKSLERGYKIQDYYTDEQFGIKLYVYFSNQPWFNLRIAADDGFWRYLSVKVVPDVVSARWGKDNEDHFWTKSRRIWLKQLWWFIYLAWNSDEKTTREIIESPNCSTDTILNFVERSGKKGTCTNAYRQIIRIYSQIPPKALSKFNRGRKHDDLFRVVMKLNTARMLVMEPDLCSGGSEGYAKKLFFDAGLDVDLIKNEGEQI